jgi:hypothetical protein
MMILIVICLQNDPNTIHLIISGGETIYPERPFFGITILVIPEAMSCIVYLLRNANLLSFNFILVPFTMHGR